MVFQPPSGRYSKSLFIRWSDSFDVSEASLILPLVLVLAGWVVFSLPRWFDGT